MSIYEKCLETSGLWAAAEDRWGQWGHLSKPAVDLVLEVSKLETINPSLLLFTWAEESCFDFLPLPNTNGKPLNMEHWDIGPFQLNVYWTRAEIRIKRIKGEDIPESEMFGKNFFIFDDNGNSSPTPFSGNVRANAIIAARRLLAGKIAKQINELDNEYILRELKERAVRYTGPGAQPKRAEDWDNLSPIFFRFFECYRGDK